MSKLKVNIPLKILGALNKDANKNLKFEKIN